MEFFHLIKASQKSGKKDAVIWFTAKSVARANLQLDVALEEAGIEETGRGKDYAKPIRTDFPVYDDLPEEGAVDYTWCERYELQNDDRTWLPKVTAENSDEKTAQTVDSHITTESTLPETAGITLDEHDDDSTLYPVVQMPFRKQLLSQFTADELRHHVTHEEYEAIGALEMDTDNSYVQNLLLAAENCPEVKGYDTKDLWRYTDAIRKVFSQDKRHELALVLRFTRMWAATDYIDRGILAREWAAGNRISNVQRTDSGTNADGGYVTDRGPDAHHTLDTLDLEIACALLPMDFNHFEIPGSILRRAKEIVTKKEEPWKSWSSILRNQPGALGVNRTAIFNLVRIAPENIHLTPVAHLEFVNQTMTAEFNSAVELLPLHEAEVATQEIHQPESKESPRKSFCTHEENLQRVREEGARRRAEEAAAQPQKVEQELVKNVGNGIFDVTALLQNSATHGTKKATETTSNVQVQETVSDEKQAGTEVQSGKSSMETGEESDTSQQADVNQNTDSVAQNSDSVNQTEPVLAQTEPDAQSDEPAVVYPAYFEPGRYEGLPNEVYHAANGISSTQVKDARVSLMYFNARHVAKTITKERSPVLDMGNLVHALALQPEQLDEEFSVEPVIPEGAFTTTATIRAFIDDYNAGLQALLSADEIKALLEEYNATLPAQVPLGGSVEETGQSYMSLPEEYQRIEADQKQTAAAMKACIKEYNATLPAQVKTSGSRDALLEQLAIINPDLVAQEAQKPQPLKVSGTKSDLIQAVKSVNPDAVFADELLDAWRENPQGKVLVTRQQLCTALAIQKALLQHPTAGMLLQHPSRAVEVSYFGFDDETGLEVRVRPDLEIDLDGVRIGADLKTISMWNIKQEGLRAKLHREIIDRDYHLSAAMYCETAALDQFFWIFVNKDENYHWIAIIEASTELLELGMLEYRKAMRAIATGFDTGEWPAPITADYTDELNDFDLRRLEALRTQA
ncbi:PD-(D/E)XK nuclease-like domain-containing protein [Escherichia coli]|jgi:exodeoxyribonuclease VIII|uniref:RecE family exodeoxyribonuclease n=1 Tax=Escherichia coli TaxID=562 RepID=UPI0017EC26E4|nr:RecE family exodeoxyribonuclease [Escherichia coli]EFH9113461.1 exodeoxyribonuclease VIII [Escherichia coli]EJT5111088.1 PD-(D/E)XK nuclease-like domain-containing protein [Escherichia coli]MCN9862099.1 PD-(D/E)XK nuclease-like domain-containing protein [Escherichia coli]MDF7540990.1 PD-(D/E)XK nuclease-like domain-containing protein [Escherichia coli]MDF7550336.1 PD-(D/E)XK nuclease-like domain-containing protein [Escherichia coli]